jgi:outer membrane autotransporter protein
MPFVEVCKIYGNRIVYIRQGGGMKKSHSNKSYFSKNRIIKSLCMSVLVAAMSMPVYAADFYVGNGVGETHDTAGAETYDDVGIASNANTIGTLNIGTGATFTSTGTVFFGAGDGADATVNVSGGGVLDTQRSWVGLYDNSNADVTVTGAGSSWINADSIALSANHTGSTSLTVSDGGYLSTSRLGIGAAPWALGDSGSGSASVLLTGAGSVIYSSLGVDLGRYENSPGTLTITNGAKMMAGEDGGGIYMDKNASLSVSGAGTVLEILGTAQTSWLNMGGGYAEFLDGATILTDGGYIGGGGTNESTLVVSGIGTTFDATVRLYVGGDDGGAGGGVGTVYVTDGAKITTTTLGTGMDEDSVGRVIVSGEGSSIISAANPALGTLGNIYSGYQGNSSIVVSDGATVSADNEIRIAYVTGSTGSVSIGGEQGSAAAASGAVTAGRVVFGDGDGSLVFNHTDEDYEFTSDITGGGSVGLYAGTTSFSGDMTTYTGTMSVDGATLFIPDGDTLTLGGDYEQTATGVLRLGSSDDNSYGKLVVDGTATFAEDATVLIDVADINTLAAGDLLSDMITAGTLNATTLNLMDNSALFSFKATADGNNFDVEIIRAVTVADSLTEAGLGIAKNAGSVWDTIIEGGTTGSDIDNVVTALGKMNSSEEVSNAIEETLPILVNGTAEVIARSLTAVNRTIINRQTALMDADLVKDTDVSKGLWVKPLGSWARMKSDGAVSGYDMESYGAVAGFDALVNKSTNVGFAFAFMKSDVEGLDSASDQSVETDTFQFITYGSHVISAESGLALSWQLDAGISTNSTSRDIDFMGRTATADYSSYAGHAGLMLSRNVKLGDATSFIPSVRTDLTYVQDRSYSESGADSLNLNVESSDTEDLIVMADAGLSHRFGKKAKLLVNAGIGYDMINDEHALRSRYEGGGDTFETIGTDRSPWLSQLGIGLDVMANERTALSAGYDLDLRDDFLAQTASVRFQFLF